MIIKEILCRTILSIIIEEKHQEVLDVRDREDFN
jgi:hypothetical protein